MGRNHLPPHAVMGLGRGRLPRIKGVRCVLGTAIEARLLRHRYWGTAN